MTTKILEAALGTFWGITESGLFAIQEIYFNAIDRKANGIVLVGRDLEKEIEESEIGRFLHVHTPNEFNMAMKNEKAVRLDGTESVRVFESSGIAVLDMYGPIVPRANMMGISSEGLAVESYVNDFARAYDHPDVKGIIERVDSPGGDVRGVGEGSDTMFQYIKQGKKPVWAYASGYMASAAYYMSAPAQKIIAGKSSMIGSIGVVLSARKTDKEREFTIVSSQSPLKRADPETEEGLSSLKEQCDDLGDIFVSDVAKYRGIKKQEVLDNYGQGAVKIAPRAVKQGLADENGSFSSTVEKMAREVKSNKTFVDMGKNSASGANSSARNIFYAALETVGETVSTTNQLSEEIVNMGFTDIFKKKKEESSAAEGTTEETTAAVLEQLHEQRADLEDTYMDKGLLFAGEMVIGSKLYPAQKDAVAVGLANAMIDDKLFGGTVGYVTPTGELAEGTREEAFRALIESNQKHSLTEKAISGVKEGSIEARVLKQQDEETQSSSAIVSADRKAQLLAKTEKGREVIAGANGNGASK